MPAVKPFIDTNVLLYLLSSDAKKADRAESVVREVLSLVRSVCPVEPLTIKTRDIGGRIAERYRLSIYDAMIVAPHIQAIGSASPAITANATAQKQGM